MSEVPIRMTVAIIAAFALTIFPLPTVLAAFRPAWVLLVFLYAQLFLSVSIPVYILLICGISLDVLLSTTLGEHVFALTAVLWLAHNQSRRFYLFSISQQMLMIGCFCFFYQLCLYGIDKLQGFTVGWWVPLTSALMGVLIWPWMRLLLDDMLMGNRKPGL